ncbi:type II CAAX endopeptidase family protein [Novosphingobium sp.]|uniref:CPBP family intramembrane glutamic endopeptidase n=1 Tax=Novosphingobium sp. TaxID=1874826 RepID=UPI0026014AD2|nr:type II CAAX endopeptidase family protein [Novosphingobium sp.]
MAKAEAKAEGGGATSASSGRSAAMRPIGAMWGWLALVVGIAAGASWVPAALKLSARLPAADPGPATSLFNLLVFGPLIAIGVVLGLLSRQPVLRAGARPLLWTLAGLACGAIAILSTTGFAWLSGGLRPALQPAASVPGLIALGVALTLLQSGAEEVLFRGWLQPALTMRIGVPGGVLASAVVFAGFHAISAIPSWISVVNLVLGGLWFGLLALRSGGILAPLAAHFAYNVIEDCGLGLVPNGGPNGNEWVGPLGALHDLDLVGSPLWGGGPEGLNASLGLTAALVAMILPLLAPPVRHPVPVVMRGPLPSHRLI